MVLLLLGTWFNLQQKRTDEVRSRAESNASRLTTMLKHLSSESPRERLLATKVAEYFARNGQLPGELMPVLLEVSASDPNKEVSNGAIQSLTALAANNQTLAPSIEKTLEAIPGRVYIQIADARQREKAKQVEEKLRERGLLVPGIENVAGKAVIPRKTNVRYFNDQDKATAEAIVEVLTAAGISSAYAYRVAGINARPGSLEVWFSAND